MSDYIIESAPVEPLDEDRQLLQKIVVGDQQAFADLYRRYSGPILTYLVRMTSDCHQAEDLLQEVYMAVWQAAGGFRGQSTVKTWMYKIAHHKAVSWLRRHSNSRKLSSGSALLEIMTDNAQTIPDDVTTDQIREALSVLSPEHRAVVELAFYHGLSYQEIAQIMSCPVGTVKSRMSYARRNLEKSLK